MGVKNLRVLVGGDGPDGIFSHIEPTLQKAPGVYNDTLLVGLDNFLAELGKRDMQAVLFLNNAWEWSGGSGQYLEWGTGEKALVPLLDGYWPYMQQMRAFQTSEPSQELFYNHVRNIVGRTNTVTGRRYADDPAIFSWQLCNEPRCFSDDPQVRAGFIGWLTRTAQIIKELDPNHLLSTGNEGFMGCENDWDLVRQVNSIPGIDYMTIHIWPFNWGWTGSALSEENLAEVFSRTDEYIARHAAIAAEKGLPLVLEEFGFPRDANAVEYGSPTTLRDSFYAHVFNKVGKELQGVNFWGWSGFAVPSHVQWEKGDAYTGDPAQEAQGLNGVYVTDSTVEVIIGSIKNLIQ
jgi:mannan endo-1,4-beta-mannosidase